MGSLRAANNAWGLLSTSISTSVTSITLQSGQGARFPVITVGSGDWFYMTIMDSSNNLEVVQVTATAGDQFTVVRGADSTIPLAFAASSRVEARIVAAVLADVMAAINSVTATANAGATAIAALNTSLTALQTTVTNNNTAQTAALNARVPSGTVAIWSGTQASIPAGWLLCNGANGTPDLRDRFVVGAGNSYAVGGLGGAATVALAVSHLPPHNHGVSDPGHYHSVSDPSHNHNFNDPGHAHGVADPGHSHGVYDPGHRHPTIYPQTFATPQNGALGGNWFINPISSSTEVSTTSISINASGTGIGIYGATTGAYNSYAVTGIGIYAALTGISTTNTGSGSAIENRPPYYALCYIMKT